MSEIRRTVAGLSMLTLPLAAVGCVAVPNASSPESHMTHTDLKYGELDRYPGKVAEGCGKIVLQLEAGHNGNSQSQFAGISGSGDSNTYQAGLVARINHGSVEFVTNEDNPGISTTLAPGTTHFDRIMHTYSGYTVEIDIDTDGPSKAEVDLRCLDDGAAAALLPYFYGS